MKQILFYLAILFSTTVFSQDLDTAKVRNFTLRAQDWAYAFGGVGVQIGDTVMTDFIAHLQTKIRAIASPTWNTNVTVDQIPLTLVQKLYLKYYNAPASDVTILGTNIGDKLQAIPEPLFAAWRSEMNAYLNTRFTDRREQGRRFLIGQ